MNEDFIDRAMRRQAQMLGLGATGKKNDIPEDALPFEDEGEAKLGIIHADGVVIVNLGKSMSWLAMKPDEARHFARCLLARADAAEGR